MMKEDFLHYIWKFLKFNTSDLKCTEGNVISILHNGEYLSSSGPDFFNAKIIIGDQLWVGNVEIHLKSSDWYAHQHHQDENYQNVILHVVWEHDVDIVNRFGLPIPTLELKHIVDPKLLKKYNTSFHHPALPCKENLVQVSKDKVHWWQLQLMINKLNEKSALIENKVSAANNYWEEVFTQQLFKNFGTLVNGMVFEEVINQTTYQVFNKLRANTISLEALLFGQAGMLPKDPIDNYTMELCREYKFLKNKYQLEPISSRVQFFKLRPDNFPTIRMSQFCHLISNNQSLFFELMSTNSLKHFYIKLSAEVSEYWKSHYVFDKLSTKMKNKSLSKSFIELLLINTVLPFKYAYHKHKEEVVDEVLAIYEEMQFEMNAIVNIYPKEYFFKQNALHSQSLVYLNKVYCRQKKCMSCEIGVQIVKNNL